MKVDGLLERAQIEPVTGVPGTANQPTGRVVQDITAPLAALPYFFDGTTWQRLAYYSAPVVPSVTFISQNSGTACTVDWSQGLDQQVILTGSCTITFTNPVANARHNLLITQTTTMVSGQKSALYVPRFIMPDQDAHGFQYQPMSPIFPRTSKQFSWLYRAAVKPAYTTIGFPYPDPTAPNIPAGALNGIDIHPSGKGVYISTGAYNPGYMQAPLKDSGFGAYDNVFGNQNPAAINPNTGLAAGAAAYSPDGKYVAWCGSNSGTDFLWYVNEWGEVQQGGSGGYAVASSTGVGNTAVAWHPNSRYVTFGGAGAAVIDTLPMSGGIFGTRITAPTTAPAGGIVGLAYSPNGRYLAASVAASPYIQVWVFNDTNGVGTFGAASANPTTLPTGYSDQNQWGKGIAWHPSGNYIAMAMNVAPYIYVIPINITTGVFGTRLTISTTMTNKATCVQFTPDGQYLLVGGLNGLYVYDFSASTVGTPITFDGANLAGINVTDLVVHPSGEYVICALASAPWVKVFPLPQKIRNYIRTA